ncbi:MAG: hypothetical protein HQL12_08240 [Candidatus Omnitrophica bacterium]|nr:hypothetical protein [Candidatus Omnitrophota bacterium]
MNKLVFLTLSVITSFLFLNKPLFASDQEIADQIQGLRDDLRQQAVDDEQEKQREESNQRLKKAIDDWGAKEKAKIDLEIQKERSIEDQQDQEAIKNAEINEKAQTEGYIAGKKKECEDHAVKLGGTPKEAEDDCRDVVASIRGLMESKSPKEIEADEKQKELEASLSDLDNQLASGRISQSEHDGKEKMLLDDNRKWQRSESESLTTATNKLKEDIADSKARRLNNSLKSTDKLLSVGKVTQTEHDVLKETLLAPNIPEADREAVYDLVGAVNRYLELGWKETKATQALKSRILDIEVSSGKITKGQFDEGKMELLGGHVTK